MPTPATCGILPVTFTRLPCRTVSRNSKMTPAGSDIKKPTRLGAGPKRTMKGLPGARFALG